MRKEMLKGAKMPPAKGPEKDDMLSMEDLPEDEEAAEAGAGEESPEEEAKELAAMPDEVLLAELKRRGYEIEDEKEEAAEGEKSKGEVSGMPKAKMPF